jgi:two-component sensor histidine kinase
VSVRATDDNGTLTLVVADDGVGLGAGIDLTTPQSFGWQLLRMLASQLAAEVTYVSPPGLTVAVSVPLSASGPSPDPAGGSSERPLDERA